MRCKLTGLNLTTCFLHFTQRYFSFGRAGDGECSIHVTVQLAPHTKVDGSCALVVGDCGVGLHFEELGDDITVAYSRGEVESCIASFVAGVNHLLHKSHQSYWFGIITVLEEGGNLVGTDIAAHKVLQQCFEVVFARRCTTFNGACDGDVMKNSASLGVAKFNQR